MRGLFVKGIILDKHRSLFAYDQRGILCAPTKLFSYKCMLFTGDVDVASKARLIF